MGDRATDVCLAPAADFWAVPGLGIVAQFDTGLIYFPGAVATRCAVLLQGRARSAGKLFECLAAEFPPQDVIGCLNNLRDAGLLTDVDGRDWRGTLTGDDLRNNGLRVWPDSGHSTNPVVFFSQLSACAGPMAPPASGWVLVSSSAEQITVGPVFRGLPTDPCPTCLAARARDHDDLGRFLGSVPGVVQIQFRKTLAETLVDQIAFVRAAIPRLGDLPDGAILVRRTRDGTTSPARALSRGGCPACGAPPQTGVAENAPGVLRAGGYRPIAATDMLQHLQDVVDPVSGIVRQLVTPDTHPAMQGMSKVCIARHAFPLAVPEISAVIRNRRGRSAGKGRDDDDAKVGAIAEALERYAGVARPDDPVHLARRSDLAGPVIGPPEWALYSETQLGNAAQWQALDAPAAWVPERFDPNAKMAWTRVTSLEGDRQAWAPASLCWHQFPEHTVISGRADSNGCAAGQTLTDARLQGLLELVERDAVGMWWWTRSRRPEIDLDSLDDPWIPDAARHLESMGYVVALQDLTHDLDLPVVAAIGWPKGGSGPLVLGFGAHFSAQVAASRAMTEIMQVLPYRQVADIGGDPRQGLGLVPGQVLGTVSAMDDLGFLRPTGTGTDRFGALAAAPETADDALMVVSDRLQALGLRIWTLDQSRADVPLPVVRMIVPGLRHFRPRFAQGRLQSVPVKLGWTPQSGGLNRLFIRQ